MDQGAEWPGPSLFPLPLPPLVSRLFLYKLNATAIIDEYFRRTMAARRVVTNVINALPFRSRLSEVRTKFKGTRS